jgi:hypothetical protein
MKFQVIHSTNWDWEDIYLDGKLIYSGHGADWREIAVKLGAEVFETEIDSQSVADLNYNLDKLDYKQYGVRQHKGTYFEAWNRNG